MQAIYEPIEMGAWNDRWTKFEEMADERVELETAHRWLNGAPELGQWVSQARTALRNGNEIDLHGSLPDGLIVFRADNTAQHHERYMLSRQERNGIDSFVASSSELLVLASDNGTVRGLRAFFNRSIPIWEGHTRNAMSRLYFSCADNRGNPKDIASAFIDFVQSVAVGFTDSGFANVFRREVEESCTVVRRHKSAKIQNIAKLIVESPDHRGVARALAALSKLLAGDSQFQDVRLDLSREFRESVRLSEYDSVEDGLSKLNLHRSLFRMPLPAKAISTVHKAKGLEREQVLLVPCDKSHFSATEYKRRLLYVAISRATKSLAIVIPRNSPSPLFRI